MMGSGPRWSREPEELFPPVVLVIHGSSPGRIHVEIVRASAEQRRHLGRCLRFLHTLPKPPASERISLVIADPALLSLFLERRLSCGSLDLVERMVGLHVLLPDDRWGQSSPVAAWVAHFRDRLRVRLRVTRPRPAGEPAPHT